MRAIKNYLGGMRGYGCCPNCGDSYSWKPTSSLPYEGESAGFAQKEDGTVVLNIGFQQSVLLCTECLNEPAALDAERIVSDLGKSGWEQGDTDKVQSAIANLQASQAA